MQQFGGVFALALTSFILSGPYCNSFFAPFAYNTYDTVISGFAIRFCLDFLCCFLVFEDAERCYVFQFVP